MLGGFAEDKRKAAEIIDQISRLHLPDKTNAVRDEIKYQIAQALTTARREQREADERIAKTKVVEWGDLAEKWWGEGDRDNARIRQGWSAAAQFIAAAIREQEVE